MFRRMTPEEAALASADAISNLTARFMLDAATYIHGGSLGFEGMSFYAAGRGGVLGDVDAKAVTEAFVFFHPDNLETNWESSGAVMARDKAAAEFAGCCARWAEEHIPDEIDSATLAALAERVSAAAAPANAPVFYGWRALAAPSSPKGAAAHHMNSMRELRFALHADAIRSQGISVEDAMWHRSPHMAQLFGWTEAPASAAAVKGDWDKAEDDTNAGIATALTALNAEELDTFVTLANATLAASA